MRQQLAVIVGIAVIAALAACDRRRPEDGHQGPERGSWTASECKYRPGADCALPDPVHAGPQCPENAASLAALVDERNLRASVDGSIAALTVPLAAVAGCALRATVTAELLDILAEPEKSIARDAVTLDVGGGAAARLRLAGLDPAPAAKAELARYVVAYEIRTVAGTVRGRRSLFDAVEKMEAVLLAPEAMPAGGRTHLRVLVRDPSAGRALEGAEIDVRAEPAQGEPIPLWNGVTDANGEATASFNAPEIPGSGDAQLAVRVRHGHDEEIVRNPLRLVRDRRILLTSDKPLYQPGQTLHLRTLTLRRPALRPEAGQELVLDVLDAKGNKVARKRLTTDAFGIAAADVRIASEVNRGEWTVRAAMGDSVVEKKIKVDRYQLPRFKVTVAADAEFYRPGEAVHGTISAQYFFGKPIAGGRVEVRAEIAGEGMPGPIAQVTGVTNDAGLFGFTVNLPGVGGDALERGEVAVALTATVTDTADHPEISARAVPLAAGPLVVTVLPESGEAVPGVENRIYVIVTDPAGRAIEAAQIGASAEGGFTAAAATDARGVASFTWAPAKAGAIVSVEARTAAGLAHRRSYTAGGAEGGLLVRTDRAVYRAGDTVQIEARAPAGATRVFLDVLRGGESVASASLAPEAGLASYALALVADMTGALQIDASYIGPKGVVRDVRPIYVDPANDLQIDVQLADASGATRTEFKPGEEARVKFHVTNSEGQSEAAALGLTAVDEAVFALVDQRPGAERVFFNLGADKLRGSEKIAGFSAADVVAAPDPALRDEAARVLFAASAAVPGLGVEVNTFKTMVRAATAIARPRGDRDVAAITAALREEARTQRLTWSNWQTYVPDFVAGYADPFGRRYEGALPNGWSVQIASAGMDERPATDDDFASSIDYWQFMWWYGGEDGDMAMAGGGPPMEGAPAPAPQERAETATGGGADAPRVRSFFPETLFVEPALITGGDGRAEIAVPLADSITTWRLSAMAHSQAGKLGSTSTGVKVFQDFFADVDFPATLTRGDEIEVPVAVHNYLAESQAVSLRVEPAAWYTLRDAAEKQLTLAAGEVRGVKFRLRADRVGLQGLTVTAHGTRLQDAVQRTVQVAPDGKEVTATSSDRLAGPVERAFTVPQDAIDGATQMLVKIYPGLLSQAVEGLDSMLRMPGGCMEQTTSSAWPNVMVMAYLRRAGKVNPAIEEKAMQYLGGGYQHLLTFEKRATTNGFGWWPQESEAANRTLTAIGLMEFHDMQQVYDIDDAILARSQQFLAGSQRADGAWNAGDALHAGNEVLADNAERATAFIAWALTRAGDTTGAGGRALAYLHGKLNSLGVYEQALAANAFLARDAADADAQALLAKLEAGKASDAAGIHWAPEAGAGTFTGARGDVGAVEVTGLVVSAMLRAHSYPESVEGALKWLVTKKDAMGNWYATQATVNALRAFVDSLQPAGGDVAAQITVSLNGVPVETFAVTPDDSDVMRTVDLSSLAVKGENRVKIDFAGTGALLYQMVERHFVPFTPPAGPGALDLAVTWEKAALKIGEAVRVTAAVTNNSAGTMDQAIVEVGLPPGFSAVPEDLESLVTSQSAARYELRSRSVLFYLMGLRAAERRPLSFRAQGSLAGAVVAPESRAWLYYAPDVNDAVAPIALAVTE